MQVTFSGAMLETVMRSYSLFFQQFHQVHELNSSLDTAIITTDVSSPSSIVMYNLLGEGVVVNVYESYTKLHLITLDSALKDECSGILK